MLFQCLCMASLSGFSKIELRTYTYMYVKDVNQKEATTIDQRFSSMYNTTFDYEII